MFVASNLDIGEIFGKSIRSEHLGIIFFEKRTQNGKSKSLKNFNFSSNQMTARHNGGWKINMYTIGQYYCFDVPLAAVGSPPARRRPPARGPPLLGCRLAGRRLAPHGPIRAPH